MRTYRAVSNYQFTGADSEFITAALLNLATLQTLYPDGLIESSEIGDEQITPAKVLANGAWWFGTDAGTANAHVIVNIHGQTFTSLTNGQHILYKVGATNTGAVTVAIDALTAKPLVKQFNQPLEAGDLRAGQVILVVYGSAADNFQLLTPIINPAIVDYAVDSGTANTLVAAPTIAWLSYKTGRRISVKVAASNTGAATLNVSGLGARDIKKNGTGALSSGDLLAGQVFEFCFDGTAFQLVSPPYAGAVTTFSQPATTLPATAGTQTVFDVAHGLGGTPRVAQVRLVCVVADSPYAVDDEADVQCFSNGSITQGYVWTVNPTNVKLTQGDNSLLDRDGNSLTRTSWKAKAFLQL